MAEARGQDDRSVGSGDSRNRNRDDGGRRHRSDGRRNRGRDGGRRDEEEAVFTPRSHVRDRNDWNDWKEDDWNENRGGGRVVLRSAYDNPFVPYTNQAYNNNNNRGGSFGLGNSRDSSSNREDLLRLRNYSSRPQFHNVEKEDVWDERLFKENAEATNNYKICSLTLVSSFYYFFIFFIFYVQIILFFFVLFYCLRVCE